MIQRLKNNKHVQNYIRAIKPPYSKHDIPHILGTLAAILVLYIFFLLTNNNITLRNIFASNNSKVPPSKPQVLVGTEHPLHIPFTHAEQGTVFIYWLSSIDPIGVAGYRIYRNGTKIGETNDTSFEDNGVSGSVTYTIEAYDSQGNTSSSALHINLPKSWTAKVSPNDQVISGFVLNKTNNSPIANTTITTTDGKTIHTDQNGYFYLISKNNNIQSVNLTFNTRGYATDTENIQLKSGQSVNQTIYLTPQPNGTNIIIDNLFKIFHK